MNQIPVKDVTEESTREEVFAQVKQAVIASFEGAATPVLFVRLVGEGDHRALDVSAFALDGEMEAMVTSLVTMLGQNLMGQQSAAVPPELAQALATATGLRYLQQRLQQRTGPQATPAMDASKPH